MIGRVILRLLAWIRGLFGRKVDVNPMATVADTVETPLVLTPRRYKKRNFNTKGAFGQPKWRRYV